MNELNWLKTFNQINEFNQINPANSINQLSQEINKLAKNECCEWEMNQQSWISLVQWMKDGCWSNLQLRD